LDFSSALRGKSMWVGAENPLTLKTLRQVLDPVGVGVHAFQHQAELEAALKEEQVDFVLLDDSGPDWRRDSLASQVAGVEGVAVLALLRNSERELCRSGPESPWRGALIRPFRGALVLHTLRGLQGVQTPQRKGAEREDVAPVTQLSRPTKILLVEDSPINRTIALKMLQKIGFEADDVHNGLEAIEACKDTEYDIVLMDCMMPVVDGYQATARIRKAFGLRRGPVIVALTANAMPEDRARSLEAGMDDHLAKPFTLEDLREKVESWISK
jgi:CheY-like chemotaxis protein